LRRDTERKKNGIKFYRETQREKYGRKIDRERGRKDSRKNGTDQEHRDNGAGKDEKEGAKQKRG